MAISQASALVAFRPEALKTIKVDRAAYKALQNIFKMGKKKRIFHAKISIHFDRNR